MKISPARVAAHEILLKIETEKAFSSILLPAYEARIEAARDRALCHEITLGVLRRQMYLDKFIELLTNGKKIDREIRIILRSALYQLIYLDKIPAHAAINDAVNLTQRARKTSAKGFVNAILRRFSREAANFEIKFLSDSERTAIETSHPRWLIEKWSRDFGAEEAAALAAANNETAPLSYRETAKTTAEITKQIENVSPSGKIDLLRALSDDGAIYFQDEASQIIARLVDLRADESFFDVCSAPGSKFSYVNFLAGGAPQNAFVGGDLYETRVRLERDVCRRVGAKNYALLVFDAEKSLPFADQSFDAVLVDAPCTGTGTIRRNPEIRYFLEEKDFADVSYKQRAILENASKLVKRGGRLIYSTCSLEPEENETICEHFLAENKEFQKLKPVFAENFLTAENFIRTFPQRHQTDGFFAAVFSKI